MRILTLCFTAACAVSASACAPAQPPTSTLVGTIDQASFPAAVTRITVSSDTNVITTAAVTASGAFSVPLAWGSSYRFFLSADGKSTPLVVRSDSGRLETELAVTSGGATVDVGAVQFWAGTAKTPRSLRGLPSTPVTATRPTSKGVASAVCVDEDGDSDHHGHGGMCTGMGMGHDGPGHQDADGADHEDNDADDVTLATPTVTDATATESVGIPANALPASIGCEEHEHHHGH